MAGEIKPPIGLLLEFPNCPKCAYLQSGPPQVCLSCARKSFSNIPDTACPVCSQKMENGLCRNQLCKDAKRYIQKIQAIAYYSGELKELIPRYKYKHKSGWSLIFGRLLVAWLNENLENDKPDIIIANPTYSQDDKLPNHTELVIDVACKEDVYDKWPFDIQQPRALIKTGHTPQSAGNRAATKREAAEALKNVLEIPDPSRIKDCYVLVYDDICTTGSQLDVVAEYLIVNGQAKRVAGIVLARTPWDRN